LVGRRTQGFDKPLRSDWLVFRRGLSDAERAALVKWGDTDLISEGGGTAGSRSLQQGGLAVRQASLELIEVARARACDELEIAPQDLVVERDNAGLSVRGVPGSGVTFAALAEKEPLIVRTVFTAPGATFPFGAHVAVVEVDTDTGWGDAAATGRGGRRRDGGEPATRRGATDSGLAQGAAQALLEEVVYDGDGNPTTTTLAEYPIVSPTEVPSFELVTSATPTSSNSLGSKGPRRGGHHRVDPGRAKCRHRRDRAPRRAAHRHADEPDARLEGHKGRGGGNLMQVTITVNGTARLDAVEPRTLLACYLRDTCGRKATNIGCDTSSCGACTVHVDGDAVKSCTVLTVQVDGASVTTLQGLADGAQLHPVQAAFRAEHALHCGFCTPGMVMARWRYWPVTRAHANERFARRSKATCAGAPAATTSCVPSSPRPRRWRARDPGSVRLHQGGIGR
jgi:aerobic-type carbon monoxide dehydrogenase small subunit (CoxS/CutS family)